MKNYSEIVVILDRSGSMETIRSDAIGGFNSFLEEQKKVPGDACLSLLTFNNQYKFVLEAVPLGMVKNLDRETYVPGGTTALLDAVGYTIDKVGARLAAMAEADRPNKVVVAILTDGLENSSTIFTRESIFDKITHQREVYKWDFIFLAANQDAIAVGTSYGIPKQETHSFVADADGTKAAYSVMSMSVTKARVGKSTWESGS